MPSRDLIIGIFAGCVIGAGASYAWAKGESGLGVGDETGRFQLQPVGAEMGWNVWRIDTRTGEFWLCSYSKDGSTCAAMPEPPKRIDMSAFDAE
jgi:hypothetical protein